jgi:ribose 5-phosphate isomerase A
MAHSDIRTAMNHESMNQDANKRKAATAALSYIKDGIALGIGTGSTVDILIELLPPLAAKLGAVVSSSERSTQRLAEFGIHAVDLASTGELDLYVDGADEATKHRHLIKGGGGALTREKIVAAASRRFVCIIDETKLVPTLGRFPVPIEVIPMARSYVARQMIKAGGQPIWREGFVTDNGNHIVDVHNLKIANPLELETRFNQLAGVVTVGIFANRPADVLLIGSASGVKTIQ